MEEATTYLDKIMDMAIEYAPSLLLAIVMLVVGFWIIKKICFVANKALVTAKFSPEITPFLVSVLSIALKVLLLLAVASKVGIETASFVALLAAGGFAIGLALQGSLGNFAAGIIILFFKPYRVGDWIEVGEKFGKVEEIQIFNTLLGTPGKKLLIIPNGQIIDNIVTNFSTKGSTRIELQVSMPYAESFPRIKEIIIKELNTIPKVLKDPAPEVGILEFDSHNIILAVRPYALPDDYWEVTFEAHQLIKNAFHKHEVQVAYSEGIELGKIGD